MSAVQPGEVGKAGLRQILPEDKPHFGKVLEDVPGFRQVEPSVQRRHLADYAFVHGLTEELTRRGHEIYVTCER